MFCPKCGTISNDQAIFCQKCGANLQTAVKEAGSQQAAATSTGSKESTPIQPYEDKRRAINIHLIGKREIGAKDVSRVKQAVMECLAHHMKTGEFVPISFGIGEFDDDPRALFDIPQVRAWAKALMAECHFILALVDARTMKWLLPCIAEIEIIARKPDSTTWRIRPSSEHEFKSRVLEAREVVFREIAKSEKEYERLCAEHTDRYNSVWSA